MTREQFIAEIYTSQETLLKAYLHYDTFQGRSSFSTWLFRIGYGCFCDHIGKRILDTESITERENRIPADDDSGKDYNELYAAIDGLTSSEKATVLLFYIEDYSTKEIADILGMASVTVRSHLHRARRHLKRMLEQNGER